MNPEFQRNVWLELAPLRRIVLAAVLMCAGGALTVHDAATGSPSGLLGRLAIMAAVAAWALDNVLTRPLADLDPTAVVRGKALFGVAMTVALAASRGESLPSAVQVAGLVLCGATGYGLSLRLYLLAQRRVGAARTGSVFALAPFFGAAVAAGLGQGTLTWTAAAAAGLFASAVALHLTERHAHQHTHAPLAHDHAHAHDHGDGHHEHAHAIVPSGPHAHMHEHVARVHSHPHGPDAHHGHRH